MASCEIKVIARFRPFNENEKKKKDQSVHSDFSFDVSDGKRIDLKVDKATHNFTFDAIYDSDAQQVYWHRVYSSLLTLLRSLTYTNLLQSLV